MFKDRTHAGRELLQKYKNKFLSFNNLLVVAIPRGGVPIALEMAKALNLPLETISVKNIGAPDNPELAIGAVTELSLIHI